MFRAPDSENGKKTMQHNINTMMKYPLMEMVLTRIYLQWEQIKGTAEKMDQDIVMSYMTNAAQQMHQLMVDHEKEPLIKR